MDSKHAMVLFVGIVCGLAAGGSRPAYAETPTAPCALLTVDEVSAALGAKVSAGDPIATTGCSWTVPNERKIVTVSLWAGDAFAGMKMPLPNVTKSSVSGVGDDAVLSTIANFVSLSVKKGNVVFIVKVYGVPDQAKQATIEKTLAQAVVGRL
jgi:hypothetical protein